MSDCSEEDLSQRHNYLNRTRQVFEGGAKFVGGNGVRALGNGEAANEGKVNLAITSIAKMRITKGRKYEIAKGMRLAVESIFPRKSGTGSRISRKGAKKENDLDGICRKASRWLAQKKTDANSLRRRAFA